MGFVQTALIPAAGFIIGYHAYKSLNYWGWIGLGTIASLGLVLAFTEKSHNFQAEDVDNALITGSVEGDPAMFLFKKGHKDDTGFTTGRIMVDDDLDEIHDTITDIQEDVGEDRIKTGFKSWKRNVWGLKPYAAEDTVGNQIFHTGCGVCGSSCSNCERDLFCWDTGDEDGEGGNLCCPCSPRPCPKGVDHGEGTFRNREEMDFSIIRIEPPTDGRYACECGTIMDVHAFDVRQEGESKILCQNCVKPIMDEIMAKYDRMEESFEAATDDWKISMKRFNPLSRHYIPPKKDKKKVAAAESHEDLLRADLERCMDLEDRLRRLVYWEHEDSDSIESDEALLDRLTQELTEGSFDAESFNADYCSTCQVKDHDSCSLTEGCPCCADTMMGLHYQSLRNRAESFEAESYREFFEELQHMMNETAGDDWDVYAEKYDDGTVEVTIEYTPLDPQFFDDLGSSDLLIFEESDEKESEHTTPRPCSICGQPFTGYGNNPEPVVPYSQGQCCDTCNATIVIPARMRGMGFMAETIVQRRAKSRGLLARLEKSERKRSKKITGAGVRKNFWKGLFSSKKEAETFNTEIGTREEIITIYSCDECGDEYESGGISDSREANADLCDNCYQRERRRESLERRRIERENAGLCKHFDGMCCAQEQEGCGEEPRRIIRDMGEPYCYTCGEIINGIPVYCTSCLRYDGEVRFFHSRTGGTEDGCMRQHITMEKGIAPDYAGGRRIIDRTNARVDPYGSSVGSPFNAEGICLFHAEQALKGKVRTMSGKPHKTRKLVKDKDITAEEAATRLKLESPTDAYGLAYNQGFDDARIAKRWSSTGIKKMTYSPDYSYKEDEKLFDDTYKQR